MQWASEITLGGISLARGISLDIMPHLLLVAALCNKHSLIIYTIHLILVNTLFKRLYIKCFIILLKNYFFLLLNYVSDIINKFLTLPFNTGIKDIETCCYVRSMIVTNDGANEFRQQINKIKQTLCYLQYENNLSYLWILRLVLHKR